MLKGTGNLKGLEDRPDITVMVGANAAREGVMSIVVKGRNSEDVVNFLNNRGVRTHTRKDDHYSGNVLKPLGLSSCIRVSYSHYNSEQEVAQFLTAINELEPVSP